MPSPTLRQIAAESGLNVSTVSRALSGSTKLPEATRNHVQAVAARLGWKPNPLASAYMSHLRSTHPPSYKATLGFLINVEGAPDFEHLPGHILLHLQGAQARAASYGYTLHTVNVAAEGMTLRRADQSFRNRNVPGILLSSFMPSTILRGLSWRRYATVMLGSPVTYPKMHRVQGNTHLGFHMTIEKAFELGYRRVGVVVSEQYDSQTDHGVLFPVSYAQNRLRPGLWLEALTVTVDRDAAKAAIRQWLEEKRPDIVIGTDVALETIGEMGWRIPKDIAYAAVDRSPLYPENAGFDQRHDLIGNVGVDLLISQINGNQRDIPQDPILHLIQGRWADGPSAPRRK